MLRKILGAFRTSPIAAMEIEAAILPVEIRFEKIYQNYAYRNLLLSQDYTIRKRVLKSFPSNRNKEIEIN